MFIAQSETKTPPASRFRRDAPTGTPDLYVGQHALDEISPCALGFLSDGISVFLASVLPIGGGTMVITNSSTIVWAPIKTFRFSAGRGMRDHNCPTRRSGPRPAAPRWQRLPYLPATVCFQTTIHRAAAPADL